MELTPLGNTICAVDACCFSATGCRLLSPRPTRHVFLFAPWQLARAREDQSERQEVREGLFEDGGRSASQITASLMLLTTLTHEEGRRKHVEHVSPSVSCLSDTDGWSTL